MHASTLRRLLSVSLCCLVAPALLRAQAPSAPVGEPIRYHMSDCHLHYVDFLQHTDGMKMVLAAMDAAGVDDTMICGMPLVKEWALSEHEQPQYYLDDDARCYWYSATDVLVARAIEKLAPEERKRFHPFICGFNSADRNAVEHVKRMLEWYPDVWEGIGEIMTRHDDLTALTYGDPAHADAPSLEPIYDLAGKLGIPISVHSDISSVWRRQPIYVSEVETALKRHPQTKFIWCHAGISRRIVVPTIVDELRRLLKENANVWIDLAWVVFDDYLVKEGKPSTAWIGLIEEFPDRFMIGSDKVGHFVDYPHEMQRYYGFLDALKPETARKVGRDNFLRVVRRGAK